MCYDMYALNKSTPPHTQSSCRVPGHVLLFLLLVRYRDLLPHALLCVRQQHARVHIATELQPLISQRVTGIIVGSLAYVFCRICAEAMRAEVTDVVL